MKSNFEQAQRRKLLSTRPQRKPIFSCFHTIAKVKSTLGTEKEPCKSRVPSDHQRNLRI
jgi:hypothetical protein